MSPEDTGTYSGQSATLLASQPSSNNKPLKAGRDWQRIYTHLESRFAALRLWRYSWWGHWSQLARYILPRRYTWLVTPNRLWRGQQIETAIIDSTATMSMQICAAGLWTGLTSPSRPWFTFGLALPWVQLDEAAREWFADAQERVLTVLQQSNFYTIMAQAFQDVVTFGTAPIVIYEDVEDVIRLYLPCAGEYYLAAGSRLTDNAFNREFTYNVSEIVEMFKLENCPQEVRTLWTQGGGAWQTEFVVAHSIEINSPLASQATGGPEIWPVARQFTWREFYWLRASKSEKELSRRGFHERPFMCARWTTVSNDAYGRGPGMDALGDVKQLQLGTVRQAEFVDKLVRPPMGADAALKNEPKSVIPGEVTYYDTSGGKKGFHPLFEVAAQALAPLTTLLEKVANRIKECFYVPIFMAISQMEGVQPRNELEITKRDLERLQVLGPFIHIFETEFASPALQRIMAIMERRVLFKPKPPSLQKSPLKITYISILRLAQRAASSVSLTEALKTGAELTEASQAAGLLSPLRILDLDEAMREIMDMANVNPKVVKSQDDVKKEDAARAQAAQQHAMAAAAPQAVQAAQSLSQTPLGGDTALAALIGRGGGTGIP